MTQKALEYLLIEKSKLIKELESIQAGIDSIYLANSKSCKHTNLVVTKYEKTCPDCSFHQDRSF